jgi:signal transduction histidine kinase
VQIHRAILAQPRAGRHSRFSAAHDITSGQAWVTALILPAGWVRNLAVGAVSVAFGVTITAISGSPLGLLAGIGAWALADRSIEHAALEAERDRTLALLAEVEASRQAQLEAAAAEERNRIAREMHDVLAHSLAGLSMQLQAVRAVAAAEGASGGSLTAGPIPNGRGWLLQLTIPVADGPDSPGKSGSKVDA